MSATLSETDPFTSDSDLPVARFTVDEYLRMAEAGAFDDMGRIELLEGYLVRKMTKNPRHRVALGLLGDVLSRSIPASWHVENQESVRLDDSMPEPDLMVVVGERRDYGSRQMESSDVELLVEVADFSLQKDRRKATAYARNRIPVYWIVNLEDDQIEVFERPEGHGDPAAYQRLKTFQRGELIPCVIGGQSCPAIPVDAILP